MPTFIDRFAGMDKREQGITNSIKRQLTSTSGNWSICFLVLGLAFGCHAYFDVFQYVEKLEKIIRFVIKEKSLTLDDLDNIWAAQAGKHEAIVKNVHELLAKLAWDFSPEQLDHLFECFQVCRLP